MIKIYTDGSCLGNPGNGVGLQSLLKMEKKLILKEVKKQQQIIKWNYLLQSKH